MSHFSTVKTQLRKKKPLKQALLNLGYMPQEGKQIVRGFRGQTVQAELAVKMPEGGGGDIGFRWNEKVGAYELVTDLDLWKQDIPVSRFLAKLTQQYALTTVLSATIEEGFELAETKNNCDGSIELVVTRWDS